MTDAAKTPTILVIDDMVAKDKMSQDSALRTILAVADTLGYDDAQKRRITDSVRFFAQYNENDTPKSRKDSPLPKEQCAQYYIHNRNNHTERPVLAFIDNNFEIDQDWSNQHGQQIIEDLRREADQREEIRPALVWISSSTNHEIINAEKLRFHHVMNWKKVDKKAMFELAKSPYKKVEYTGTRENMDELLRREDQVLIHTLRDAFEFIAGKPAQKPWKEWVSERKSGIGAQAQLN